MARKIIQELNYTFNPATRTITVPRYIAQEKLILITNVTSNTVIYNFSDNSLRATSYTSSGGQQFPQNTAVNQGNGLTTIVLNFNTSAANMSSSDKLQFLIDDFEERYIPGESYVDPANKMRVSTPQSLIDTDFELGLQTTKWEFFQANNGAQSIFTRPTDAPLQPVTGGMGFSLQNVSIVQSGTNQGQITGLSLPIAPAVGSFVYVVDTNYAQVRYPVAAGTTTTTLNFTTPTNSPANGTYNNVALVVIGGVGGTATNPSFAVFSVTNDISGGTSQISVGTPIFIQDTFDETAADGTFTTAFVNTSSRVFAFIPKSSTANFNVLNRPNTVAYVGAYYGAYAASSNIQWSSVTADGSRIVTVNTVTPHGLTVGTPIFISGTTQVNANGPWYILAIPTPTQFTYSTLNIVSAGTISQVTATVSTQVNLRPEGNQTHRPQDGGVQITPGNNVIGAQAIRQTRRYFRYQSGKGIQFSTAFTFKPNYDIVSLTINGNVATVITDQDHGLRPGTIVRFTGLTSTNLTDFNLYNNTFVVLASQPVSAKQFSVQLAGTPTDQSPGGASPTVECVEAKGYAARAGLFDDQNGMFWEYDGSTLNVVRRNATSILRGNLINVCTGSTLVTGDARSRFTKQCIPGDRVVIRGQTYVVTRVTSDTEMNISPAYRAATQSTAQGTSGLPYSTLTAASSQLQTINISTTVNTAQVQSAASSGGALGSFTMTNTFNRTTTSTGVVGSGTSGVSGARNFTISAFNASIVPGMLVIGAGIPANTYVDASYVAVAGTVTIPLTQAMTAAATATTYDFFLVPASGVNVTGTGLGTNTQVSSIVFTTTGGTTTSGTVGLTQAMTAAASGTYTYGLVTANIPTSVITLATTYGISPGMVITGGGLPGNVLVAFVQPQGTAVVLNQPVTIAAGIGNGVSLTFQTIHSLTATVQNTSGSTATSTNQMVLTTVSGISVGNFVTTATPGQFFAIGTYVTGINTTTNTVTLSQNPVLTVPTSTAVTFSSRVFVVNSSQANLNGQWPVFQITSTQITFHTAAAATVTGTVSTFGVTRVFGEDLIGRKGLVRELRIPQTQFNLDTLDGRGPSGFNLDPTKAQMIFMDYTWYGAGFARWGVRATGGDIIYCHKLQHGNTQYQAFLRSGNLPGRFELNNIGANSPITTTVLSSGYTITPSAPGTINVFDASKYFVPFTDSVGGTGRNGEVLLDYEYFYYTGLASTTGLCPWAVIDNGVTSVATLGAPTIVNGSITAIPVTSGGAGYTASPPIVISGPGGGARAVANVVNGSVVSVTVTAGGTGFTSAPTILIGPNQLTGVVREPNAVTVGALTGATTVAGSTGITGVTNASSYYVGMRLGPIAAFNNQPVTIIGILGSIVFVDAQAVSSGSISISPIQKGGSATSHFPNNNTGLPISAALNTVQQLTPAAQHWGVSVMMDGRFDDDKSYVFTTPRQTASVVQQNTTAPLISIRVSPSVSLGFARNFGVRDIINRMQLNLYQMDVYTSGQFLITVRYNCSSSVFVPALWTANLVGSGSLSQVIYHNPSDIVTGGDVVLAYYATNAGTGVFAVTQQDLKIVKDLGNSVIGGDSTYPDGPDVITVFATNLSTSVSSPIYARLSWNEAQA